MQQSSIYHNQACFYDLTPYIVKQHEKDQSLYSSLGAIIGLDQGSSVRGTAFLIGSSVILTAAHNVFNLSTNHYRKDIRFYHKAFGNLGKGIKVVRVSICEEYLKGKQEAIYDFAFCLLEEIIEGDFCIDIGYNFELSSQQDQKTKTLNIYGYPGENWQKLSSDISKNDYSVSLRGLNIDKKDFRKYIEKTDISRGQILHRISTKDGQSGSPIIAELECGIVAIGLVKGSKLSLKQKKQLYNGGVLFNKFFVERLRQFASTNSLKNISVLNIGLFNLSQNFWNLDSMSSQKSFEVKRGAVTRTTQKSRQMMEIRSWNLKKALFDSNVLKLRLNNFRYEIVDSKIEFGVQFKKSEEVKVAITYITYSRGQGRLTKGSQVMFKAQEEDLFISQKQLFYLTVDFVKGEVCFSKESGGKLQNKKSCKFPVSLLSWCREGADVFFYTKMMYEECGFEVNLEVIEKLG